MAKMVMGETAEILAEQYKISREEQDQFALCSQKRAAAGASKQESVPERNRARDHRKQKRSAGVQPSMNIPFVGATLEKLAKLSPVFSKTGTITAGNSSGITDGAAAMVLASEDFVKKNKLKPLARIVGDDFRGSRSPHRWVLARCPRCARLEKKHKLKLADFDLVELNEAFAAQVLACDRELHFDRDRLNVNGGAIALGHPIGCTGDANHRDAVARDDPAAGKDRSRDAVCERWHGDGTGGRELG